MDRRAVSAGAAGYVAADILLIGTDVPGLLSGGLSVIAGVAILGGVVAGAVTGWTSDREGAEGIDGAAATVAGAAAFPLVHGIVLELSSEPIVAEGGVVDYATLQWSLFLPVSPVVVGVGYAVAHLIARLRPPGE